MTIIGTVKSQGLNVRARPALHAKKLDALTRGDEVEILDRAAPYGYAWLKVKARKKGVESGVQSGAQSGVQNGVTGWVYAADVDIAPPPPDAPRPAPAPEPASPAPPALELNAPAQPRAPRRFFLAAIALAAIALIAWLLG
jgi:SH3 domain-containing protein